MIRSENIASPPPGSLYPLSTKFSPDGQLLTFLYPEDSSGQRQIFYVDCNDPTLQPRKYSALASTTSTDVSPEEQARRERMRLFTGGMISYQWVGNSKGTDQKMIVPFGGRVLKATKDGDFKVMYDAEKGTCTDPTMSPDGNKIAFVIEQDLYAMNENDSSSLTRLTKHGAESGVSCGLADYLAQEEMDRYEGFWWAPNSKYIAYTETNENNVPVFNIAHPGKDDPKVTEAHNYPFAGYENAKVKLAVLKVGEGNDNSTLAEDSSVWMDLAGDGIDPKDYYLGRVGWWPDESVMAQVENRLQNKLQLLRLNPLTGERTVLVEENSKWWINLHDLLYKFPAGWAPGGGTAAKGDFYFLWASERSGFSQLYMYHFCAASNQCEVMLGGSPIGGGGDFVVEDIAAVDTTKETVFFTGNRDEATEKHLYCASFSSQEAASKITKLTSHISGWHTVAVSTALGMFASVHSSTTQPPTLSIYSFQEDGDGPPKRVGLVLNESRSHPDLTHHEQLANTLARKSAPVFRTIKSLDGEVDLHCALYLPDKSKYGPGPYPTVMNVYGGPHVMRVMNHWSCTVDLRSQRLVERGCLVIRCDNRGSFRRGIAFEGAIHRDMGRLEVDDQRAAVEYFASPQEKLVNASKVGMIGWSYGGYMSAMALCRAPDTFCCSVAGAPVTSWDGYDTHYTERYMGLPAENVEGYRSSSVMTHVDNYRGRMMLVHGLIDENVHFRHTARLINKLVEARKCYDLMLFPCERHSPHGLDNRVYLEDGILSFFLLHLGDADDDNSNKSGSSGAPRADMAAASSVGSFLSQVTASARL